MRLDLGRLIMAPLCAYVVLHNGFIIYYQSQVPLHAPQVLSEINDVLVTGFYILMLSAYLSRPSAQRTSRSVTTNAIAVIATFLSIPLLVAGAGVRSGLVPVLVGTIVAIAGMAFSLYSVHTLGRSFSIIPQSRAIVVNGPYKYLRHPLYAGEIVAMTGFVIAHLSVATLALLVLLVVLQAYRAIEEEKILASTLPAYQEYMSITHRLVPRLF